MRTCCPPPRRLEMTTHPSPSAWGCRDGDTPRHPLCTAVVTTPPTPVGHGGITTPKPVPVGCLGGLGGTHIPLSRRSRARRPRSSRLPRGDPAALTAAPAAAAGRPPHPSGPCRRGQPGPCRRRRRCSCWRCPARGRRVGVGGDPRPTRERGRADGEGRRDRGIQAPSPRSRPGGAEVPQLPAGRSRWGGEFSARRLEEAKK